MTGLSAALLRLVDLAGWIGAFGILLIAGNHWRLAVLHGPAMRRLMANPPPPLDLTARTDLPHVTVQIPVFNEAPSLEGAIARAVALEWPRDRLTIQLLDDSTDNSTQVAASLVVAWRAAGHDVRHLRRDNRAGFKAGALAAGLAQTDAAFLAILDVDHRAPPDWLRRAIGVLEAAPRAAFVQFRFEFGNGNANILTRAQQLSADAHFLVEQVARREAGEIFQFNGTAAVWRREAIDEAGGWSADTLAEDLDLVIRAFAAGWQGELVLAPPVRCEAPATVDAWRIQQARWSSGFAAGARKLAPKIWQWPVSLRRRLGSLMLLGLQAAFPCALLALVGFVLDIALRAAIGPGHLVLAALGLLLVAATAVIITLPAHRALRRGSILTYAQTLASLPLLLLYLAACNSAAILTAALGRTSGGFVRTPKQGDQTDKEG